jgi:hypothetical protein
LSDPMMVHNRIGPAGAESVADAVTPDHILRSALRWVDWTCTSWRPYGPIG